MNKEKIFLILLFLLIIIFIIISVSISINKRNNKIKKQERERGEEREREEENNSSSSEDEKIKKLYPEYDPEKHVTLKTMNYNIFGRWFNLTGYEGQTERLKSIPAAIAAHPKLGKDVDIITIEEGWCPDETQVSGYAVCGSDSSRNKLLEEMKKYGWAYHTDVIEEPGASVTKQQTSGGTLIVSKWPIESTTSYVYKSAKGQDKSAAKGAVYVRITKTNSKGLKQVFNILGTHLQAWSTPEGAEGRKNELNEIMTNYLPNIGIKSDGTEPVLFQGDMNIDYVLYPEEVDSMLQILKAELPKRVENPEEIFSSNPSNNFLVGKDGAAEQNKCLQSYKNQLNGGKGVIPSEPTAKCQNIPSKTASGKDINPMFTKKGGVLDVKDNCTAYCSCCPHEMLDYILYSKESKYLQPIFSNTEIIPLKSLKPIKYKWGWCDGAKCLINKKESGEITANELSDHYPIVSNFVFSPKTQNFIPPDGCKFDSDCDLEWAYCYCKGPNCTINGKVEDGFEKGHKHVGINKNCKGRISVKGSCFCRPGDG